MKFDHCDNYYFIFIIMVFVYENIYSTISKQDSNERFKYRINFVFIIIVFVTFFTNITTNLDLGDTCL